MKQETFLSVPVDVMTLDDILNQVAPFIEENRQMRITSVNPQIVTEIAQYPEVLHYIQKATYRLPDGIGIVKASEMRQGDIHERLTGFDVMVALLEKANQLEERIFLYGAAPDVVEQTKKNIEQDYPHLQVVGAIDGYTDKPEEEIVMEINNSGATFLFVAMGFPLQETFLNRHYEELNANIIEDVGGSFDVLSGAVKRAPQWIQNLHLEWLYRSLTQKGRLNRIVQVPIFLWKVKREAKEQQRKER